MKQGLEDVSGLLELAVEADDEETFNEAVAELDALEEKLATPLPPADIAEAGKRLKAVGDELDASEERWLELSEAIEQLTQAAEA